MLEKDIVRAQLTLRAVVWDIADTGQGEAAKLKQELRQYQIIKIAAARQSMPDWRLRYERVREQLEEAGVLEADALLVTECAPFAEYAYKQRTAIPRDIEKEQGLAVVFYEKEEIGRFVAADIVVQGFEEISVQFLDRIHKRANHLPWNILYTKRTCVREIAMGDLDALFALYEGKGITTYIEPLYEREKEAEYTKSYIDCMYYYYGYGMWVICDKDTGVLIGRAGIEHRDTQDGVLMELGYIIASGYQNQGYAVEVCSAILEYATDQLQVDELHCFIHPKNLASIRVAEKLGFLLDKKEGTQQNGMLHFSKRLSKKPQKPE